MSEHNAVVGVYNSHTDAEAAVKALQQSGFDMQKLSIVGKGLSDGRARHRLLQRRRPHAVLGHTGGLVGLVCGLLVGAALFVIPGLGPVIVFGPLVGGLVGALGGAVVGRVECAGRRAV